MRCKNIFHFLLSEKRSLTYVINDDRLIDYHVIRFHCLNRLKTLLNALKSRNYCNENFVLILNSDDSLDIKKLAK